MPHLHLARGERKDRGTAMGTRASSEKKTNTKKENSQPHTETRTETTGRDRAQGRTRPRLQDSRRGEDRLEGQNGGRTCGARDRREITRGVRGGDWGKEETVTLGQLEQKYVGLTSHTMGLEMHD